MINTIQQKQNYIKLHKTQQQKQQTQFNITKTLLLILFIWNLILSFKVFEIPQTQPPQFTDQENEIIMQLEEIPQFELTYED